MQMTSRTTLALAVALLFALAACSDGATSDGGGADEDTGGFLFESPDTSPGADAAGPEPDAAADAAADAAGEADVDPGSGFEYPCDPGTFQACVTACASAGEQMCLKDWGPCIPPDEFCGNCVDDDCDGAINEDCPPNPECDPEPPPECPVAAITIAEGAEVGTGTDLHLSGATSTSGNGPIVSWAWSVQAPAGSQAGFAPGADVESPTFLIDVAGSYLFSLVVTDDTGIESCFPAQAAVYVEAYPPLDPEIGCADGAREGFLELDTWPQIAGCAGAWDQPGITPDAVVPTCGRQGGDDGGKSEGAGCSAPDLCAEQWHVCVTWEEVAAKSPTGCAGAAPPDAKSKSLFFAIRQPSETGSVCGDWGDGFNDVFGCGNLGAGLGADKGCGPIDRVLASTQPDSCGFNEAEPNLGPWECYGGQDSHLNEGALVRKEGCPGTSCSYDGYPVGNSDKGGVLCCRD